MDAYEVRSFVAVLIGLFAWCCLYARVLALHPEWYIPTNKTWVTVLFGVLWTLIALGVLTALGIFGLRDLGIVILTCAAAGAPIIIWQYLQDTSHRATLRATERKRNGRDGTED